MKKLIKGFFLLFAVIPMLSIIGGTQIVNAVTLLNISNSNSTTDNNSSILNGTNQNTTVPTTIDSIQEDNRSGNIASLPSIGKCLGSALCPD